MVNHDDLLKPLWIATAITHHPCIVIWVTLAILVGMTILDGLYFTLSDNENRSFLVEDDPLVVQFDAWSLAKAEVVSDDSNSQADPQTEPVNSWTIFMMFELKTATEKVSSSTDYWILTPENLEKIVNYENQILQNTTWKNNYCLTANITTYDCTYLSIAQMTASQFNYDYSTMTTANIKTYIQSLVAITSFETIVKSAFNSDFEDSGQTFLYRSFFQSGGPIPTDATAATLSKQSDYKNIEDKFDEQDLKFSEWADDIWIDITVNENAEKRDGDLRIVVFVVSVFNKWFNILLQEGMGYIVFAMMAVLFWMTVHLQSLFLSLVAMFGIMSSFPFAWFLYFFCWRVTYFDTLSILIVFVLLGIGADDVFVFTDAWHQSVHFVKDKHDLLQRMTFSYRRASKAMLVTQTTTLFAFIATAFSLLMPISAFGIWAATIVACNYILVITLYPSFLMIHYEYIKPFEQKFCCFLCKSMHMDIKPITKDTTVASSFHSTPNRPKPKPKPQPQRRVSFDENVDELELVENEEHQRKVRLSHDGTTGQNDQLVNGENDPHYDPDETGATYRPLELFLGYSWTKYVTKVRFPILVLFLALFSVSVYLATLIEAQDENEAWFDEEHYMQATIDLLASFSTSEEDGLISLDIAWGVAGVDRGDSSRWEPSEFGSVVWDDDFDLSSPDAQTFLYDQHVALRSNTELVYSQATFVSAVIGFRDYIVSLGKTFPFTYMDPTASGYDAEVQKTRFNAHMKNFSESAPANVSSGSLIYVDSSGQLRYIALTTKIDSTWDASASEEMALRDKWLDWMSDTFLDNGDCVTGVCKPIIASLRWAWLRSMREFVNSALQGIAIAMPLAFAVLIASTHNWIMSCLATTVIIGIIGCELAVMSLQGWKFGISESISIVIMIGFSVDYVVHFANAYLECESPTRHDRLQFSMLTMGISVVSGAITTLLAGMFLSFPEIIFFQKMGILILTTIALSLLWSMVFFVASVATCGPEHGKGDIPFAECCRAAKEKVYGTGSELEVANSETQQNDHVR